MIVRILKNCVAMTMIIGGGFLAWSFVSPSLLGKEVPASVAATIRGGAVTCIFASSASGTCVNVTNNSTCSTGAVCTAQAYKSGTGNGTNFKAGTDVCCGASATTCSTVYMNLPTCGQG